MEVLVLILFIALASSTVMARQFTEEDLLIFPKLFHLDDYDRCLVKKDGLYCLGIFDLTPDLQPNPTYDLLKVYSDESYHFNRTRIHRGICVSSRCPQETTQNASQRFEHCVDKWARARTLRASINTLHYCQTHADKFADKKTTRWQEIYIQCIIAIVVINIIGTIYDVYTGDDHKKNKLLSAFSIASNWRRLTIIYDGGDPRITALKIFYGYRVIAMLLITYAHSNLFPTTLYTQNPEYIEKNIQGVYGIVLSDGSSIIHGLVTVSCFLTCYNLLLFSQKRALSLSMLPLCILKRIIRIFPVSLFVLGFASTWWIHTRDGPLVPTTIGLESRACQTKFWYHVFYLNNIVEPAEHCVAPTWFLPVDMHMYIVACTLTLLLWRRRITAIKLYSVLFLASCTFIGVIAYIREYKSVIFFIRPENVRRLFRDIPSFTEFYTSSWGSLSACFLGLLLGHIQFELDERKIKLSEYRWFVYLHYITAPFVYAWAFTSLCVYNYESPIIYATYLALDRPISCIFLCIAILGVIHVDGPFKTLYSWNGWTVLSRLGLTVMLLHWCVNLSIATRPVVFSTSPIDVIVDWAATNLITYILAVPITVLLEIPMQKFLGSIIFNLFI